MPDSGRRFCRLCRRSRHVDEMLPVEPRWAIATKKETPARLCADCFEYVRTIQPKPGRAIVAGRFARQLAEG